MNVVLVLYLFVPLFREGYSATLSKTDSKYDQTVLTEECFGKKSGLYPYPGNCSRYIHCGGDGSGSLKSCEANNHFHPEYNICVWEQIYPCPRAITKESTWFISFCKEKPAGTYKDPKRCEYYIICTKAGAYHMKCPTGFLFNTLTNKCDNATYVNCNVNSSSSVKRIIEVVDMKKICDGKKPGNYEDPTSCNDYIACTGSSGVRMKCPEGLWFNEMLNKCDSPTKVICKLAKPTFSCKGMSPGKYAVTDACEYFYLCTDTGDAILKKCPKHTNFQPVYRNCVWTYVYSCDDPKFCSGKSDGKYQNMNNCYGYYQCFGGKTFPRNCDPGWRFNGTHCVDAAQYICPKSQIRWNLIQH